MTSAADRYDVVVVGVGLVGLASGALLAQQGLRVLAVERHAGTSVHPKARLLCASAGLTDTYGEVGRSDQGG